MFNRYSQRGQRAVFNPMSFEQYAAVPLMAQQTHDKAITDAQSQLDSIKALGWHSEETKKAEAALNKKINDFSGKLTNSNRGIYDVDASKEIGDIRNFKRDEFTPIQEQAQGAVAARQDLIKRYRDDKDHSEKDLEQALQLFDKQSQDSYSKDGAIGYQGRLLAKDPDVTQMGIDYADNLPKNTQLTDSGWTLREDGIFFNTKTKITSNGTPTDVQLMVQSYLQNNNDVTEYLSDQAMVQSELYLQKDENGNIVGNGKAYNPDKFNKSEYQNDFIQNKIHTASQIASRQATLGTEVTQDMRNASTFTLGQRGLLKPDASGGLYYTGVGTNIKSDINESSRQQRSLLDAEGNTVLPEQLDDILTESIQKSKMNDRQKADLMLKLPQLREELYKMKTQESQSGIVIEGVSAGSKKLMNSILLGLGLEDHTTENLEGVFVKAKNWLVRDGYTTPDITKEERAIMKEVKLDGFGNHIDNVNSFAEGTSMSNKYDNSEKSFKLYESAFKEVTTPKVMGLYGVASDYFDANIQNVSKTKSLASVANSGSVVILDEEGTSIELGNSAKEWLEANSAGATVVGQPFLVTEGLTPEYMFGSAIRFEKDGKYFNVVVPTDSEQLKARAGRFQKLALIQQDANMSSTQGGNTKFIENYDKDLNMEYINTVDRNGQAVTMLKPYYDVYQMEADGVTKSLDKEKQPIKIGVQYVKEVNPETGEPTGYAKTLSLAEAQLDAVNNFEKGN